jgi:hypothetical protein
MKSLTSHPANLMGDVMIYTRQVLPSDVMQPIWTSAAESYALSLEISTISDRFLPAEACFIACLHLVKRLLGVPIPMFCHL